MLGEGKKGGVGVLRLAGGCVLLNALTRPAGQKRALSKRGRNPPFSVMSKRRKGEARGAAGEALLAGKHHGADWGGVRQRRNVTVMVILAYKYDREVPEAGNVESLILLALVGSPIAITAAAARNEGSKQARNEESGRKGRDRQLGKDHVWALKGAAADARRR